MLRYGKGAKWNDMVCATFYRLLKERNGILGHATRTNGILWHVTAMSPSSFGTKGREMACFGLVRHWLPFYKHEEMAWSGSLRYGTARKHIVHGIVRTSMFPYSPSFIHLQPIHHLWPFARMSKEKKRLKTDQKIAKKKTLADQFFQIFRKKADLTILSWSKIRLKLINWLADWLIYILGNWLIIHTQWTQ